MDGLGYMFLSFSFPFYRMRRKGLVRFGSVRLVGLGMESSYSGIPS